MTVFTPVFARLQNDRLRLSQAFFRAAYVILRSGFLVAGAFGLVMPEFIHYVIGDKWLPMLWTFRLMLVYTALDPYLMLISNLMLAVGRPQDLQRAGIVQSVFFIPAVALGAWFWEINGVALAADVMLLVGVMWLYRPLRELVDFSVNRLIVWPAFALIASFVVGLAIEQLLAATVEGFIFKIAGFLFSFCGFIAAKEIGDLLQGIDWIQEQIHGIRSGST